jgi:hypothetical protein
MQRLLLAKSPTKQPEIRHGDVLTDMESRSSPMLHSPDLRRGVHGKNLQGGAS